MDYSPEAFEALIEEIEKQGGALLPDPCESLPIEYKVSDGYKVTKYSSDELTCGCNHESRVVIVYEPEDGSVENGTGFATCCAVCDSVGAQPRFIEAVVAADPDMDPIERPDEPYDQEQDEDA